MKIDLVSDVHLEFGGATIENNNASDVLILAGDVLVARHIARGDDFSRFNAVYDDFIEQCISEYNHVIYILGNHEHYNGNIDTSLDIIKERYHKYSDSLHIIENEVVEIDSVRFLGGTCWSNMNNNDPLTKIHIRDRMNDFQIIEKGSNSRFTPDDAVLLYEKYISFLFQELEETNNSANVVISHHPPTRQFIHPKYVSEYEMNGGYCNDLDDFILEHQSEISAWVCGHCHHVQETTIGDTRLFLNPRGYHGVEHFNENITLTTFEVVA